MDCKFTLHCKNCDCNTEISVDKWHRFGRFECPNCHKAMPELQYQTMCEAIENIIMVPSESETFAISVKYPWKETAHSQTAQNQEPCSK